MTRETYVTLIIAACIFGNMAFASSGGPGDITLPDCITQFATPDMPGQRQALGKQYGASLTYDPVKIELLDLVSFDRADETTAVEDETNTSPVPLMGGIVALCTGLAAIAWFGKRRRRHG